MKIDYKREFADLYAPRGGPALLDVPPLMFLMVDGHGDPNTVPEYPAAIEALYAVAYAAKFLVKRSPAGIDFTVMPLEGLWWAADTAALAAADKSDWNWTAMIMQPEPVTSELAALARENAAAKKSLPALEHLRFASFEEGKAAQVMFRGPYADEEPAIAALHTYIAEQGLAAVGKHHEIYLNDPNRTAPEKLKTIIRQPVSEI